MKPEQALAWVKKCGIAVESGHVRVPSLAQIVAGEPVKGSWWAHAKGKQIFRLSRKIRASGDVLVCRLVDGKITYVHKRLWPALVSSATQYPRQRLAALREVHTRSGKHKVILTPYPKWVPKEVMKAAGKVSEEEASARLAALRH